MNAALEQLQRRYPGATPFRFGDSETLCEQLVALVCSGEKTATCGALRDYAAEGEPLPFAGGMEIAQHWDGSPAVVIAMTSVELKPFCEVEASFALAEGENDSLAGWRESHRAYFARNGGFDETMRLVCQRFRVVEVFG